MKAISSHRVLYFTITYIADRAATLECMRRHHWRRHFECLRCGNLRLARYHRELAQSIENPAHE